MKVYLGGPMTGHPEHNYPAFTAAAAVLRAKGYEVINPAENDDGDASNTWDYYMRQNIIHILNVDAIIVLPGWEDSFGCTFECLLGYLLKVPSYEYSPQGPHDEISKDRVKLAFISQLARKWRK